MADYSACGWIILTAEAYAVHEPWLKTRFNDYGELFRDRLALGGFIRATDYVQAMRRRRMLCEELKAAMARLDILVSASQAGEAPKITEVPKWGTLEKPSLTMPFNLTGYPAMSVCTGFGAGGLPVSMQLIAKPFAEPTLFQAATPTRRRSARASGGRRWRWPRRRSSGARHLRSSEARAMALPSAGADGIACSPVQLYLRRHADVLVLVDQIIHRVRGVVLHLEHRDHALLEIAVLVEADLALQRLQLGRRRSRRAR